MNRNGIEPEVEYFAQLLEGRIREAAGPAGNDDEVIKEMTRQLPSVRQLLTRRAIRPDAMATLCGRYPYFFRCAGAAFEQLLGFCDDNDGTTLETAVVVFAEDDRQGVDAEYRWLSYRFPGYERIMQELVSDGRANYDIITIRTRSGEAKTLYFNITSFFGC